MAWTWTWRAYCASRHARRSSAGRRTPRSPIQRLTRSRERQCLTRYRGAQLIEAFRVAEQDAFLGALGELLGLHQLLNLVLASAWAHLMREVAREQPWRLTHAPHGIRQIRL